MHSEVEKLLVELRAEVRNDGTLIAGPTDLNLRAASLIERLCRERESLREGLRHLPSIAENFMLRFSVHDLPEDKAQQWQSLEHEIEHARRLLGTHAP